MLMFLLGSQRLQGQAAGSLQIVSTVHDPATGITRCTINWVLIPNANTTVRAITVTISVAGAQVCVNPATGANPSTISSAFPAPPFDQSFTPTGVTISRTGSGVPPTFTLPANTIPFVVLSFRAAVNSSVTITAAGSIRNADNVQIGIGSASATTTMPSGGYLAGQIFKPNQPGVQACTGSSDLSIPGVKVIKEALISGCFPGTSYEEIVSPSGHYGFANSLYSYAYRVTPSKQGNSNLACGIEPSDINMVRLYIVGSATFNLLQVMAADFNQDDKITGTDVLNMERARIGDPNYPVDSSFFLPGYAAWRIVPNVSPTLPTQPLVGDLADVPTSRTFTYLSGMPSIDFWGVKRGDLNGTCQSCGNGLVSDEAENRSSTTLRDAQVVDRQLYAGEEIVLPISAPALRQMGYFGMELFFDPEQVELIELVDSDLPREYSLHSIVPDQKAMVVRYSWLTLAPAGVDVPDQAPLFYVRLRAKRNLSSLQKAMWQQVGSQHNWLYVGESIDPMAFRLTFQQSAAAMFSLTLAGANPVSTQLQVNLTLPDDTPLTLSLLDQNGLVVKRISRTVSAGPSSLLLTDLPTLPGLYTVVAQTSFGQKCLRFVKI